MTKSLQSNLDNQIERLKKATEEVNKACESLDTKMASARSYGITVGKAISLALDRVDSFDTKLDGIKAFKFTAVLDILDLIETLFGTKTILKD